MEGFLICGVLGILGLSLVGLITVLRAMFGKGRQPVVVRSAPEPLTRTEKLGVVWEVLGTRRRAPPRLAPRGRAARGGGRTAGDGRPCRGRDAAGDRRN